MTWKLWFPDSFCFLKAILKCRITYRFKLILDLVVGERLRFIPDPDLSLAQGIGTTDGWTDVPSMGWELLILCTPDTQLG